MKITLSTLTTLGCAVALAQAAENWTPAPSNIGNADYPRIGSAARFPSSCRNPSLLPAPRCRHGGGAISMKAGPR